MLTALRRGLFPVICLAALAPLAAAHSLRGIDEALQARLDALVQELETQRQELHIPGMALAIVRGDELLLAHGFGLANVEQQTPVTPETLFAIGSSTKAFTTALLGMLVDEGLVSWDTPITDVLPDFVLRVDSDPPGAAVSLRDLVTHRTGFTRMGILWAGGKVSREEILATASRAEPWDGFRKHFHYNNVMYLAAGMAAARLAETDWDTLLAERLLQPLGMTSSNTSVQASQLDPRLALGYRWDEHSGSYEHLPMRDLDAIAPAGAINSNVLDMTHWLRLQLGDGEFAGRRLLSAARVAEMRTPQILVGGDISYGLGWMLHEWQGRQVVEHGGNIDGFSAEVALMPGEDLGFVLLTNVSATPLQSTAQPMVWSAVPGDREAAADAGTVDGDAPADDDDGYAPYLGEYMADYAHFHDVPFTVQVNAAGRLAIDIPGQTLYELVAPDAEGLWHFALTDTIAVRFVRDSEGRIQSLEMHQGGTAFECPRRGTEYPREFEPQDVEPLLGRYHDPALAADVEVKLRRNRLAVDIPGQMVFELRNPDDDDIWWFRAIPGLGLQFLLDDAGPATALRFHERGSVRNCPRVAGTLATLPSPDEVAALCGLDARREAFVEHGALRLSGTLRLAQSGVDGSFVLTLDGPERCLTTSDFGPFARVEEAYGDGVGTRRANTSPYERLSGRALRQARQDHPALSFTDWRLYCDRVEVAGRQELDGRSVLRIRLHADEQPPLPPLVLYVDTETGDTLKLEGQHIISNLDSELPYSLRFDDFRELDGLRIPHRIVASDEFSGRLILTVEQVQAGIEVQAADFVLADP